MRISENGLHLIESFEGYSSAPYWDAYGRVWTRGYGETEGIGPRSSRLTRAQAEANLRRLLEQRYEWALRDLHVPLNQNQWDALCSFVWNLGAGIFTGALRDALLRRDWRAVVVQMLKYDHAGGVVLAGLARRRQAEAALFLRPDVQAPYVPADEARWEHEYDQLGHRKDPWALIRRAALRRAMRARMREIWHLAQTQKDGWATLDRANRYHRMQVRL